MPAFLEQILKKRYEADSDIPYRVMNAQRLMRGSKETPKGARLQRKHEQNQAKK